MFTLALLTGLAQAQEKEPYDHTFSLTNSPLQLLLPVMEVTGEYRLDDRIGFGGIGSIGASFGIPVAAIGPTFRYYPVGDFDHGMQLGADLQFVVAATEVNGRIITATGAGFGPFIGYKIAARFGLTFEIQGGVGVTGVQGGGETFITPLPVLNLNLGWSF